MGAYKELEKLEEEFLKEKKRFLEKVAALKQEKMKELKGAEEKLEKLKSKLVVSQRNMDHVLKTLSTFKLKAEDLMKQNLTNKKKITELKLLKARIPKQINELEKKTRNNVRVIGSLKRDSKIISLRKTKAVNMVKDLSRLVQNYETIVIKLTDSVKELAEREKNLLEGKIVWAEKTAMADLRGFVKKYFISAEKKVKKKPKRQPKKKPAKKKSKKKVPKKKAKKKVAKKKSAKRKKR